MKRFQITYIARNGLRTLFGSAQGRRMHMTREATEDLLRALLEGPENVDNLRQIHGAQSLGTFRVDAFDCHDHGDPKGIYVTTETLVWRFPPGTPVVFTMEHASVGPGAHGQVTSATEEAITVAVGSHRLQFPTGELELASALPFVEAA